MRSRPNMTGITATIQRNLGSQIRFLRESAKLTRNYAAQALYISESTVWRIETGTRPVKPREVEMFCSLYQASAQTTDILTTLAGHSLPRNRYGNHEQWLPDDCTIPTRFGVNATLERESSWQMWCEPSPLPASLQVDAGAHVISEKSIVMDVVITERTLRQAIRDATVTAEHLRNLSTQALEHDCRSIRIVPMRSTDHRPAHSYTIFGFPDYRVPVVRIPTLTGYLYLDSTYDVQEYQRHFNEAKTFTLDREGSQKLLHQIIEDR